MDTNQGDPCVQCRRDTAPPARVYVEWSTDKTTEDEGCVAEIFCGWCCAAHWFCTQAGRLPPQQ